MNSSAIDKHKHKYRNRPHR